MKTICLYMHVHQPYRIRQLETSDLGISRSIFDAAAKEGANNKAIIDKVSDKSYIPTNKVLLEMLQRHPEFRFSLSITGTLVEQLKQWRPDVLDSFKELVATGRVEITAETYYHSLAYFYDVEEFEAQVDAHAQMVKEVFGVIPEVFRNTELAYTNSLAHWAQDKGYKAILAEGWDPVLGWRSPNFVYHAPGAEKLALLLKNYRLSDDIAFRFSNKHWAEYPLSADKFAYWVKDSYHGEVINLFMDYETFGEHQWVDTGILEFLDHLPHELLRHDNGFMTLTEAAEKLTPKEAVDVPHVITWADTERDLTAWTGNAMQQSSINALYKLKDAVMATNDPAIIGLWRNMQTSDHFYYMCTKWFNDGDVHAYFSPYSSPYDAHMYFVMALHDLKLKLMRAGVM